MLEFAHRDQEGDFIKKQQKTFETYKTDLKKKLKKQTTNTYVFLAPLRWALILQNLWQGTCGVQ